MKSGVAVICYLVVLLNDSTWLYYKLIWRLELSYLYFLIFFFFFSSRRRHTRWNCDWSSDVCSSDLYSLTRPSRCTPQPRCSFCPQVCSSRARGTRSWRSSPITAPAARWRGGSCPPRSEERRVGKRVDLGGRGAMEKKNE